ncbi:hypothetical protein EDD16DRAFT_1627762 [Pisolithus croceorrhizus]|nr:hypothetical protein EDD16DRAFT_1627762 [Pisolithus croceorrhizus]
MVRYSFIHIQNTLALWSCVVAATISSFPHLRKPDSAHNHCHARLMFEESIIFADQHVRSGCQVSIIFLPP